MSDAYWELVSVLAHFDGADNSTTFTEETGKTFTRQGDAKIMTTQSKFGGSSLYLDGTGDYLTLPASWDLSPSAFDWTVEFWFYRADTTNRSLVGARPSSSQYGWMVLQIVSNKFRFMVGSNNSWAFTVAGTATLSETTWYHVAIVRTSGIIKVYLNGVADITSSAIAAGTPVLDTNTNFNIRS